MTGVGGVGKTRLALQVAAEVLHQFGDGVWLCELGATNDADLLGQVLVAALGVQPRPGRSLVESVCDYLAGKQALIVLDNCEHLLDAAAEAAEAMLRAAPGVRVLATSRELLGVAGERVVGVRSLRVASVPDVEAIAACDAVRLFVERAGATRSEFRLDADNADSIVEICRRLDGIPLAVELAAARVTSMGPGEIADLLDERFQLLTGGRRRGVERHQTLRATVDWSYSLLDARDRRGLRPSRRVRGELRRRRRDRRRRRRRALGVGRSRRARRPRGQVDGRPGHRSRGQHAVSAAGDVASVRVGASRRHGPSRGVPPPPRRVLRRVRGGRGSGHGGPRRALVGREVRGRTRQPPRRGRLGARRRGAGRR